MKVNFTKTNCFVLILVFSFACSTAQSQVYTEYFSNSIPAGWIITNGGQGNNWGIVNTPANNYNGPGSTGNSSLSYGAHNSQQANAWAITKSIALTAGKNYRVEFYQKVKNTSNPERLKVTVGTVQSIAGQSTTLLDLPNLTNSSYTLRTSNVFTATTTGNYYFGFNCYSVASRKDLYIDYIKIVEVAPVIVLSTSSLDQFISSANIPSDQQSYTVSGTYIQNGITVTAPAGFEISLASGSQFSAQSTINIPAVNGSVAATTVYVRSNSADANVFTGTITNVSGTTVKNVSVSGNNAVCIGLNKVANISGGLVNWSGLNFPGGLHQACDNVTLNISATNLLTSEVVTVNLNSPLVVNNLTINSITTGPLAHSLFVNTNGQSLHVKGNLVITATGGTTSFSKVSLIVNGGSNVLIEGDVIISGNNASLTGIPSGTRASIEGIGTGASLIAKGNFVLNENASVSNTSLILEGNSNQALENNSGAVVDFNSLVLSGANTKSISGNFGIVDSLKLHALSILRIGDNDTINLRSTADRTASLSKLENGSNIIYEAGAAFVVERFIPSTGKAWFHLAAPSNGQTIKQAWQEGATTPNGNPRPGYGTMLTSNLPGAVATHGYDVYTSAGSSVKVFNATTGIWESAPSTSSQISNKEGYMIFVRGDRGVTAYNQAATSTTLRTAGKLYTTGTEAPATVDVNANQFASVANPYASAIDFGKISRDGGIQDVYYVWDPRLNGSYGYGAFQTFINTGNGQYMPVIPGGSYADGNTAIESGMAFMVYATGDGSLEFSEDAKTSGSEMVFRPGGLADQMKIILSTVNNGNASIADASVVMYEEGYDNGIDDNDVRKLKNTGENLAVMNSGIQLTAERRNALQAGDTIQLFTGNMQQRSYRLDIESQDLGNPSVAAILIDRFTAVETPLNLDGTSTFSFDITADANSKASNRFYIVFRPLNILPVTFTRIAANRINANEIAVKWDSENEYQIQGYTIERSTDGYVFSEAGQVLPASNNHGSATYSFSDLKATSVAHFYRIKATSVGGLQQYSAIIKVSAIEASSEFSIYPNPVEGKVINLYNNGNIRGYINGSVLNNAGNAIMKFSINANGRGVNAVLLPASVPAGTYLVVLEANGERKTLRISVL